MMDDDSYAFEDPSLDPLEREIASDNVDLLAPEDDVYGTPPGMADQPVPRISVMAFCELPETGQLIRDAAEDRRMARAHVDVLTGGLPAAIEKFHDEPTPNLVIVESGMRGRGLFEQLDELASVCDAETKVIIIGAANDIALYRELMRRGVSEYLVPPLSPVHLIRAVSHQYADPESPFLGKTVAFIGARGGVGSSTIAHNTAWSVAEAVQVDATIVDLDLSFGTASLDFNQDSMQGVAEALTQPERVDDVLLERLVTRCTDRLTLFSAPATLDRDWELEADAYETVVDAVRKTTPFVALDLPHTWSVWVRRIVLSADEVVITATPDLASLRNTKNLFDLASAARPNDAPPRVVLNQVNMPKRPEIPIKDFADALGGAPTLVLPFDPALFGAASNNGQMLEEVKADSKPAEGLKFLASLLAGRPAAAKSTPLLKRLLKRG